MGHEVDRLWIGALDRFGGRTSAAARARRTSVDVGGGIPGKRSGADVSRLGARGAPSGGGNSPGGGRCSGSRWVITNRFAGVPPGLLVRSSTPGAGGGVILGAIRVVGWNGRRHRKSKGCGNSGEVCCTAVPPRVSTVIGFAGGDPSGIERAALGVCGIKIEVGYTERLFPSGKARKGNRGGVNPKTPGPISGIWAIVVPQWSKHLQRGY